MYPKRCIIDDIIGRIDVLENKYSQNVISVNGKPADGDGNIALGIEGVTSAEKAKLAVAEVTTNKGAGNGYAPLASDAKVPVGNLPTGVGNGTVPLIKAQVLNQEFLYYDAAVGGFRSKSVQMDGAGVYGGDQPLESTLPTPSVSGTWYVVYNMDVTGPGFPGLAFGNGTGYDVVVIPADFTQYELVANKVNTLQDSTVTYPSSKVVNDAIDAVEDTLAGFDGDITGLQAGLQAEITNRATAVSQEAGTRLAADTALSNGKVDKTTLANRVYGTDASGNQTTLDASDIGGGATQYLHSMLISSSSVAAMGVSLNVLNDTPTPFTLATLQSFFNAKGITGPYPASGKTTGSNVCVWVFVSPTNMRIVGQSSSGTATEVVLSVGTHSIIDKVTGV